MKHTILILLFAFFILSVNTNAEDQKFGTKFTVKENTKISKILADAETHLDKTVKVEGVIVDVCPMAGCWMDLKSDDKSGELRVKVNDGDMVFPVEAKGKLAIVEGKLFKKVLTKEQNVQWQKHLKEEKGETFDPNSVTSGATIYQLKPTAVVIKEK
jgi:hypothetical protein